MFFYRAILLISRLRTSISPTTDVGVGDADGVTEEITLLHCALGLLRFPGCWNVCSGGSTRESVIGSDSQSIHDKWLARWVRSTGKVYALDKDATGHVHTRAYNSLFVYIIVIAFNVTIADVFFRRMFRKFKKSSARFSHADVISKIRIDPQRHVFRYVNSITSQCYSWLCLSLIILVARSSSQDVTHE